MFDTPSNVAAVMRDFAPDWFFAGGWAIDLFLEKETRPHDDVEIAVFRKDHLALQSYLRDWDLKKAMNGVLVDWKKDEFLELPIHEIHCFKDLGELRALEVLLNETNGAEWIFRREKRITRQVSKLSRTSASGMKFLCPEVVLLYKSKRPRTKDERDFQAVVEYLDSESREWLGNSLSVCYSEHHWLKILKEL